MYRFVIRRCSAPSFFKANQQRGYRSTGVLTSVEKGRQPLNSYTPPPVQHHIDLVQKYSDSPKAPISKLCIDESLPSIVSALKSLETVIGIRSEDVCDMLSYAPSLEILDEWIKILLTWEGVMKGGDLFLHRHGGFPIAKAYSEIVSERRTIFLRKKVELLHVKKLRREYTKMKVMGAETIRASIPHSPETDIFRPILQGDFKQKGFCNQDLPFPLFVESQDGFSGKKLINHDVLLRCLFSGGVSLGVTGPTPFTRTTPFWLVATHELHVNAYFDRACHGRSSDRARTLLIYILSQDEDCPQRQHILNHRHFWNNPENVDFLEEIVMTIGGGSTVADWPQGGENLGPRQLLNRLSESKLEKRLLEEDVSYDYLSGLPDWDNMKVLRSHRQIDDAAKRLHNCALDYAPLVEDGLCVLVLLEDERGKAIALGMHPLEGTWPKDGWSEIYEACNQLPSKETMAAFESYSRVLRRWYRHVFGPESRR